MDYNNYQEYQEPKKSRFRFWFLAGAAAVLVLILLVAAVLLITTGVKEQKYSTYIAAGNEYYSAGDYQNAIVEYQNALELDETKTTAYLNMSSAYIQLGDYISARSILTQGLAVINSSDLQNRLAEVEILTNTQFEDADLQELSQKEIDEVSAEVTVENTAFDMVAAYTYTDYVRDFGESTSKVVNRDSVEFYYSDIDAYAFYYDLENEDVLDEEKGEPIATSKPCSVQFTDISRLFESGEETYAVSKSKLIEFFGEDAKFYMDDENEKYYMEVEYKKCRFKVETDADGNIISRAAWNEVVPLYRQGTGEDEGNGAEGRISGYIQDAVSGRGMSASLKIRTYGDRVGEVLGELQSTADGSYTYSGEPGKYTIEVSAAGYISEYLDVEIFENQVQTGKNIVLSPNVGEGEIRIVLTWGAYPTDLDSHTDGNSSAGSSFSINFTNKSVNGVGALDVDDTNGFGPETTTITDAGSDFTFSVVDYTNSGEMSTSGATVKVYLSGSTEAITYTVPAGAGNTWKVFSYSNGNITPINTMN